jgi:hypothetical protein
LRSIASLLLLPLLVNSAPVLQCAGSLFAMLDHIASAQSDVPDCCKNGMCPMHHHHGDSDGSAEEHDCICKVASQSTVVALMMSQAPAIGTAPSAVIEVAAARWSDDELIRPTLHTSLSIEPPPPRL